MTAEQILGIAQTATDMLSSVPAAAPTVAPQPSVFDVGDDEYVSGAQLKRYFNERPATDDVAIRLAGDASLGIVKQQFAQDFARYGPEIDALIARVPSNLRTIDNLQRVVKMIRSDHVDEIAAERAQQLAATMAPGLRPTGGGAPLAPVSREHSLESEKIPPEWKERARAAKITEDTVAEFCRANDMTPIDFYKQFDSPRNRIAEEISRTRSA